uniref:TNPO1 n=1 Tax=Rhabditophanes sp. KR3021 TaxID=114890 RepID=A0AC35TSY1_9BILA
MLSRGGMKTNVSVFEYPNLLPPQVKNVVEHIVKLECNDDLQKCLTRMMVALNTDMNQAFQWGILPILQSIDLAPGRKCSRLPMKPKIL